MRGEGFTIESITPQNESRHKDNRYPSMRMEPSDQARFIGKHLGPALQKANILTKILCWDHSCDRIDFPMVVMPTRMHANTRPGRPSKHLQVSHARMNHFNGIHRAGNSLYRELVRLLGNGLRWEYPLGPCECDS